MPTDSEIEKRYEGMALVVAMLGPILLISAALTVGSIKLLDVVKAQPGAEVPRMPPLFDLALRFAELSAYVTIPLGLILLIAGLRGLKGDRGGGRRWMLWAGWITVAAMVLLAVVWEIVAFEAATGVAVHIAGVALHLFQAALVLKACQFLKSPALVRLCDPSSSSSSSSSSTSSSSA